MNSHYKENECCSNNHDSWNLNITPKWQIDQQKQYYARPENHKRLLERSKARQRCKKLDKKEYDRKYYIWRKSWGDLKKDPYENIVNNLLNIQGDVFT